MLEYWETGRCLAAYSARVWGESAVWGLMVRGGKVQTLAAP